MFERAGLGLDTRIDALRPWQDDVLTWALELEAQQPGVLKLINAPTGSGKTLINAVYGLLTRQPWTYGVNTIRLQEQVAETFPGLLVLKGRRNFLCDISLPEYGKQTMADEGRCVAKEPCPHGPGGEETPCGYYAMLGSMFRSRHRTANYAMYLSMPPLKIPAKGKQSLTQLLLADEAHNIEDAVCNHVQITVNRRTAARFGIGLPWEGLDLPDWIQWGINAKAKLPELVAEPGKLPDFGLKTLHENIGLLASLDADDEWGKWVITGDEVRVQFQPIWGKDFAVPQLFGPVGEQTKKRPVRDALFTSATLMGADYYTDTLGLEPGSWAYYDMPSTFDPANRPVYYSPVVRMNAAALQPGENETRATMQTAVDNIIRWYFTHGVNAGLIHAVSNKYRDHILSESRWRETMTSDVEEHTRRVKEGELSVLVAANLAEGWDGADDLCRFILMPKVPFPDLGDRRTKIRMAEDPRSYDHKALVTVVQGAGRGVRHQQDTCDTWILDESWRMLYGKRREWLPESFMAAYKHNVKFFEEG